VSTKVELEKSIRDNFSIIFGLSESVARDVFLLKYNAFLDSAAAVSASVLGPETIRYQSMLLYVSAFFVSVSLFRLGKIKVFDNLISVDRRLLVIYAVFIGGIIVVFLIKAYVDYQRARFLRSRHQQVTTELRELIAVGLSKRHIQEYFWLELFDAIGRTYKVYDDAGREAANGTPEFKHTPSQALVLDRKALYRNIDTRAEIVRQETFLASLVAELTADEKRFQEEAEIILAARAQPEDPMTFLSDRSYEKIRAAFEQTLDKWFVVRNSLTDEHLDSVMENLGHSQETQRLEAMIQTMKRILTIRRMYAALEIVVPVVFAIFAIVYVQFG
jgi:hypothetical protein